MATAIATTDIDGDVIVVGSSVTCSADPRGWWKCDTADVATDEYFSALSDGLLPASQGPADVGEGLLEQPEAQVPLRRQSVTHADPVVLD